MPGVPMMANLTSTKRIPQRPICARNGCYLLFSRSCANHSSGCGHDANHSSGCGHDANGRSNGCNSPHAWPGSFDPTNQPRPQRSRTSSLPTRPIPAETKPPLQPAHSPAVARLVATSSTASSSDGASLPYPLFGIPLAIVHNGFWPSRDHGTGWST